MIRGKFIMSGGDTEAVFDLRRRVFAEEQGFDETLDKDLYDDMSVYALVFDEENRPMGTGRLFIMQDRFTIGRVCVLKEARGQGYGDLIMRMLLYRALDLEAPAVYVSSQLPVVDFYKRYGFEPDGDIVYEEGVAHRPMKVLRDRANLEGSCSRTKKCSGCQEDCRQCHS